MALYSNIVLKKNRDHHIMAPMPVKQPRGIWLYILYIQHESTKIYEIAKRKQTMTILFTYFMR